MVSATSRFGFSTKRRKSITSGSRDAGCRASSSQPYPVSGRVGLMPKVTIWPATASEMPACTAAPNASLSGTTWSDGMTRSNASGSVASKCSTAARIAGAVLRGEGSIRIGPGSMPTSASCSVTMKRKSELVITTGGITSGPTRRCATAWNKVSPSPSLANCLGKLLRDSGQRRVPDPPQSRTG